MNAWIIKNHGDLSQLKLANVAVPEPKKDQVRIKVKAVGLNHMDIWVRKGVAGHKFPLPLTPGCDVAGEIDQFGELSEKGRALVERNKLTTGVNVVVFPVVSCGACRYCIEDFPPLCADFGLIGETENGGLSDYLVMPIQNLVSFNKELSFEKMAALPIVYVTAWTMLHCKAQLKADDVVLIHAGGSGVSVAATQLAKQIGAKIITTVGSEEKKALSTSLGADYCINYKTTNFRDEVKKVLKTLDRKGVDVVLDHVGGEVFEESLKCLNWGGKIVFCGATSGSKVKIDLKPIFFKNISILGSTMGGFNDFNTVVKYVEQGQLDPCVDSVYPFSKYPDAVQRLEGRNAFGKVVVSFD